MRFHMKPFTAQQGVGCRLPRAYVRCIRLREYLLPLKALRSRIKIKREDVGRRGSFRLFSHGAIDRIFLHMPLQGSVPDTFTLASDYESRVAQLLDLARQQVRLAKGVAAPRTHDVLTELDYILEDQLAALANAIDNDKADAEAPATRAA